MTRPEREVRVPRDTVNDDHVTIVRWLFADGEEVPSGTAVVELETSKSVIEVEAAATGTLATKHAAGEKVRIGELLATIGVEQEFVATSAKESIDTPVDPADTRQPSEGRTISLRAQRLMDLHRLAEDALPMGLVKESDIMALISQGPPASELRAPQSSATKTGRYGLLGDAQRSARERNVGLPRLVLGYLWRNWFLGNVARIAPRGVITVVHWLRGVRIGKDCFIDPNAILETAYPENLFIGNDVRIAAGAILMTHIKAPHFLRDKGFVPSTVRPVRLEDHCFIGVNAVIMPGVTVGKASVVASGAVVISDVPPFSMVAGNPAKVVKTFPYDEGSAE